ncbi:MAG TPA: hypothetical protein VHY37_09365 [Tepidisphaeraceae bacterium]|jgi:hypothetical protein|nr:hypothetical protein [Tepidisphaeraceae bacterium]
MFRAEPPKGTHVPGTNKGEEMAMKGREPGRDERGRKGYRSARDSTSINAGGVEPIDPRMPEMPPA